MLGPLRGALGATVAIAGDATIAPFELPRSRGIVVYRKTQGIDAIDEYSRRLVGALDGAGHPATYVANGLRAARTAMGSPHWIFLQYMPFSYGRWGFAPDIVADAAALKRASGALLGVMIHEAWVDMDTWRTSLMGAYQRIQLRALLLLADVIVVSMESFAQRFGARAVHLPVGSNITPTPISRERARADLGIADEVVVALFGTGNPHRMIEHSEAAVAALAADRGPDNVRVLNLGSGAGRLRVPPQVRVLTPGELPADDISRHLRASDVLLLSFSDGISTRRTTLMAGLAHGLPIVAARGANTDDVLLRHPDAITLAPVGDERAFARATVDITRDHERLVRAGSAARALYATHFDWPVIARRLVTIFDDADSAPARRARLRGRARSRRQALGKKK